MRKQTIAHQSASAIFVYRWKIFDVWVHVRSRKWPLTILWAQRLLIVFHVVIATNNEPIRRQSDICCIARTKQFQTVYIREFYVWLSFSKTRTVKVSSFALVSSIFPRNIRFLANYVLQQSAIRLHDLQFPLSWRRYCTRCKFCFKQFFCFSVALESHLSEYEHRFIPLLALCVPH